MNNKTKFHIDSDKFTVDSASRLISKHSKEHGGKKDIFYPEELSIILRMIGVYYGNKGFNGEELMKILHGLEELRVGECLLQMVLNQEVSVGFDGKEILFKKDENATS